MKCCNVELHSLLHLVVHCLNDCYIYVIRDCSVFFITYKKRFFYVQKNRLTHRLIGETFFKQPLQELHCDECAKSCVVFPSRLTAEVPTTLQLFLDRLRNEITRLTAVKSLDAMARSGKVSLSTILDKAVPVLANFLRKNQRSLKISTLKCLDSIFKGFARFDRNGANSLGLCPIRLHGTNFFILTATLSPYHTQLLRSVSLLVSHSTSAIRANRRRVSSNQMLVYLNYPPQIIYLL